MTIARLPLLLIVLSVAAVATPRIAVAGPFTDDLSKCLVSKTSPEDKTALVQWIFTVIALHPSVADIAKVPDAKREAATRKAAALFEVLVTDRCLAQAQQAIKFEGTSAFEASFKVLGEIAAGGLFADPAVAAGSAQMASYLDEKKIAAAFAAPAAMPAAASNATPAAAPSTAPTAMRADAPAAKPSGK